MESHIVSVVVGKIVEKTVGPIVNTVVRQFSYIFCYKKNIQTLDDLLKELEARREGVQQCIVEAGWNLETADPSVELWLTKVDDIKTNAMEVRNGTSNAEKGCLNGWCPNLKHRYLLSRKAKKLTASIGQLKREGDKDRKFSHPAPPIGIVPSVLPSVSPKDDGFKGFATRIVTMNDVMDALKDDKINLIGISGMGGVGKTTLVKQVLEKVKAVSLFNQVAMAVVSQQLDLVKIQDEIAEMLGLKFDERSSIVRAERLRERIKRGGRVLVVLDDVWEGIDLNEVGIPAGNGCKVVFTTRMEGACNEMKAQRHITVQTLSQTEAWDLFREEAGDCVETEDLGDIAKGVAQECGGLPIALVTLGKALSKRKKYEWEDTMLKLKKSSGMDGKVKSSIMLSYEFLESRRPHAQPLLLLCTLFDEDEDIHIEQLVKYSMGLDQLSEDVETFEETRNRVYALVDNLKFCNLLLRGDDYYDGRCVKLHDVVRDVCMSIAANPPYSYHVRHSKELQQWPQHNRHKSHTAIALNSGAMNELPGGLYYPNLRLLQLQLNHEKLKIAGDFFHGMRGLQVFNFDGKDHEYHLWICNVILPPTLGLLTNLQALSLEYCDLDGDLSSIGCLKGLKILSFYKSELHEFPRGVGELKNLKFLDLRCNRLSSHFLEASLLSGLDQLEVVYMGHCLVSSSKELKSLSCLTALQICLSNSMILLELEESFFDKLKRFEVSISDKGPDYSCGRYGITRNTILVRSDDLSWVSHTKLRSLMRRIQSFTVSNYNSVESLFLPNLAKCMVQLESLTISDCERFNGLISNQGKEEDDKGFENIQFPKLKFIELSNLYNFKSFYPESGNEDLEGDSGTTHSLFNQWVSFPSLEDIHLNEAASFERIVGNQMLDGPPNKLKWIKLSSSNKIKNFVDSTTLENLEKVIISSCHSMEVVFDLEGLRDGGEDSPCVFDKLARIHLIRLKKLAHVWRMVPDGVQGFRNLITLEVWYCRELRYLMSYSVAKMLVNLQVLKMRGCPEIVVVIEGDDKESSTASELNECIVFPQLQKLVLCDLEKLTYFCSSKCSLEFPVLHKVQIRICLNMKRFCGGEVKAPVLKQPVEDPYGGYWFWEGNLNNGIHGVRTCQMQSTSSFLFHRGEEEGKIKNEGVSSTAKKGGGDNGESEAKKKTTNKPPFRPVPDDTKSTLQDPILRSDPIETEEAVLRLPPIPSNPSLHQRRMNSHSTTLFDCHNCRINSLSLYVNSSLQDIEIKHVKPFSVLFILLAISYCYSSILLGILN